MSWINKDREMLKIIIWKIKGYSLKKIFADGLKKALRKNN